MKLQLLKLQVEQNNSMDAETRTGISQALEVVEFAESLVDDGMDCPFCDYQQHQYDGHRDFCPMRHFVD